MAESADLTGPSDLLRRSAGGDRAAFAAFYDATIRPAYALALAMTGDRGLTDRALAQAYAEAWREAARQPLVGSSAGAWLCGLVQAHARAVRDETHAGGAGAPAPLSA